MKLAVMQPYFFPYIGYFSLIKYADKFILLDSVQYIKQGWINRNRILNQNGGWQYVIVPLRKHHQNTLIKDIMIASEIKWKKKIIAKLAYYRKIAPFYEKVITLIKEIFEYETDSISKVNIFSLKKTCDYLDIPLDYEIFSEMEILLGAINEPDDWALEISKLLKAKEYINPPGGKEFFDKSKYISAGIELKFLQANLTEYDQKREKFEPGLSIIDVMMFNSKESVQEMLNNYEFI